MKKTLITLTILIGFIFAEDPTLNVQGVLRDADGVAVPDGENYQLTFHLYDVVDGGSSLWSEDHTGVSVINGVYSVELGGVSTLGGLTFATPYYLGIAVNGGAESTPRIPLSMSPYALSVRGTSNVFPNDGSVGIGTTDPTGGLDVHSYTTGEWGNWRNTINLSSPDQSGIFYDPGGLMMGFHSNRNIYFGDTQNDEYRMTLTEANVTVAKDLVVAGKLRIGSTQDADMTNGALEIGDESGTSIAIDANEIVARDNGQPSTLHLNASSGLTNIGGNLNVDGDITIDNQAPIVIRRFGPINGQPSIEVNTGFSSNDYSAAIIGANTGWWDYNENGGGHGWQLYMQRNTNASWHIIGSMHAHQDYPDWTIDVMFIRKELVDDDR